MYEVMQAVSRMLKHLAGSRASPPSWRGADLRAVPRKHWENRNFPELPSNCVCFVSWKDVQCRSSEWHCAVLRLLAGELQVGAASGGGTEVAMFFARLFQRWA